MANLLRQVSIVFTTCCLLLHVAIVSAWQSRELPASDLDAASRRVDDASFSFPQIWADIESLRDRHPNATFRSYVFAAGSEGIDYIRNPNRPIPMSTEMWKEIAAKRNPTYPLAVFIELCSTRWLYWTEKEGRTVSTTTKAGTVESKCRDIIDAYDIQVLQLYFPGGSEHAMDHRSVSIIARSPKPTVAVAEDFYQALKKELPGWLIRLRLTDEWDLVNVAEYPIQWPFSRGLRGSRLQKREGAHVVLCEKWIADANVDTPNGRGSPCILMIDDHR